ncbi:MAG: amino acid racemase [Nanoarchaeota archaeon]
MPQEKIIVIGGGVGPMAGVGLHRKIIENTLTDGTDQSHLEVFHLSRSNDLSDRTEFLLNKTKINPAQGMFRTMQIASKAVASSKKQSVAGIPCNTFHAKKIFERFLSLLKEHGINMKILNMLEETANFIRQYSPDAKKIGLRSTTGTRSAGVYNDILGPFGYEIIQVPEKMQAKLHDSIYNNKWGLKAVSPITPIARSNFEKYAEILRGKGAEVIVLGCTEIPLALPEKKFRNIPLVDPMTALARALIMESNYRKLRDIHY